MGKNEKAPVALALPNASKAESIIATIGVAATDVLRKLGEVVSKDNLTPGELSTVFYVVKSIEKILGDKESGVAEVARKKVIAYLKGNGQRTKDPSGKDGNGLTSLVGGWLMKMHPYRTGFDPKLVTAKLLAKEKDPEKFMDKLVTFDMPAKDSEKMMKLQKLLGDELDDCKFAESWTVSAPTPYTNVKEK